jgi:ATP-dependent helicase/DNAse subunit B
VIDNLSRARTTAQARFVSSAYTAFDGELRDPAILKELTKQVGAERVFSPTALENYIACPFRFLLRNVLRLEPLEDPSEEVQYTRRGSAFHRALARFHQRVKSGMQDPADGADLPSWLTEDLVREVEKAVGEYAARAPSKAAAELWKLEGKRLERAARRYRDHWTTFRAPWQQKKAMPYPHHFEVNFGVTGGQGFPPLVLNTGGVEVRIGGFIDRIDLVQFEETLGFWVIDYKTGRATSHQSSHVARLEKLQLPLYAMAVERVLLYDSRARPLGLAYWLVTDTGAKSVLPAGRNRALAWLETHEEWARFSKQLEKWIARIVTHIRGGDFPLAPRSENCTDSCSFGCVCRIAQSRNTGKVFALELPVMGCADEEC